MGFYRTNRDIELFGDVFVFVAFKQQIDNLLLPWTQVQSAIDHGFLPESQNLATR
jgi:hypothetical protein